MEQGDLALPRLEWEAAPVASRRRPVLCQRLACGGSTLCHCCMRVNPGRGHARRDGPIRSTTCLYELSTGSGACLQAHLHLEGGGMCLPESGLDGQYVLTPARTTGRAQTTLRRQSRERTAMQRIPRRKQVEAARHCTHDPCLGR